MRGWPRRPGRQTHLFHSRLDEGSFPFGFLDDLSHPLLPTPLEFSQFLDDLSIGLLFEKIPDLEWILRPEVGNVSDEAHPPHHVGPDVLAAVVKNRKAVRQIVHPFGEVSGRGADHLRTTTLRNSASLATMSTFILRVFHQLL